MNRKGTEKPIEIFVALFIILAVALVMLKLFNNQITEKQKELADVQQEQKAKELYDKVKLACEQKCTAASNNGCSLGTLASLCSYGSGNELQPGQYIDLNNDKQNDMDTTLMAGVGVCEDHVYCFHIVENCCARRIDPKNCKQILNDYWTQQGFTAEQIYGTSGLLNTTVGAGTCKAPASAPGTMRWDKLSTWTGAVSS
jgi:hypothetical protein